jgi:hypothetical protein
MTDRWRIRVRVRREEERWGEDEKRRGRIGKVGRRSTRSCAAPPCWRGGYADLPSPPWQLGEGQRASCSCGRKRGEMSARVRA